MAVTENDIIQNASAIASLFNTGSANVNITDLDAVTSLSDSDLFHVSVSNVDKKITKANLGLTKAILFTLRGNAYVGTKITQALMGISGTISSVKAYSDTAPVGADLQIDINKNGTTIFTTQGNRPIIADGTNSDTSGTPDVTAFSSGDRISVDIDQKGSTTAGGDDLTIAVIFS